MSADASIKIIEKFWNEVWQPPQDPEAIDRCVTEDFVITSGGVDIVGRAAFKRWVIEFQSRLNDIEFDIIEMFASGDAGRVVTRFRIRGTNNGFLGTKADRQPVEFTGISIWSVRADGLLDRQWVERSALELYRRLSAGGST